MALYHATIKIATNNEKGGMRASAHYAYLCRTGVFEKLKTAEELVSVKSGNLPTWAAEDPSIFWLASDTFERKNGSVYRELEAALPRELTRDQQRALVQSFIDKVLRTEHPYTIAIHDKPARDGLPQPHIHLMWSERKMDGIERDPAHFFKRAAAARKGKDGLIKKTPHASDGGCQKVSMGTRLEEFRELWALLTNEAYAKAGLNERVSHLSLAAQGIDRDPEPHLGPTRMVSEEGAALLERRKFIKVVQEERQRARAEALEKANAAELAEVEVVKLMEMLAKQRVIQARIVTLFEAIPPKLTRAVKTQLQQPALIENASLKSLQDSERSSTTDSAKPRAYSPERSRAEMHRAQILRQRYGGVSEILARFWRFKTDPAKREVIYEQQGARIVDRGSLIVADHGNQAEIKAMIELAMLKKWGNIVFTGSDEFKLQAMVAGLLANLNVQPASESDIALLKLARISAGKSEPSDSVRKGIKFL